MSADEQCQAEGYPRAHITNKSNICEKLDCYVSEKTEVKDGKSFIVTSINSSEPAAEGTTCDKGKICLHNTCRFQQL